MLPFNFTESEVIFFVALFLVVIVPSVWFVLQMGKVR